MEKSHELRLLRSFPVDKAQFPGYVHRLTVGSHGYLKEIKNDSGALVYVLSLEDASLAPAGHTGACVTGDGFRVTVVVLVGASLTDVEVEAGVKACDPLERGEGAAVVAALRGEKKMY